MKKREKVQSIGKIGEIAIVLPFYSAFSFIDRMILVREEGFLYVLFAQYFCSHEIDGDGGHKRCKECVVICRFQDVF